jgi:hypothetical protein
MERFAIALAVAADALLHFGDPQRIAEGCSLR